MLNHRIVIVACLFLMLSNGAKAQEALPPELVSTEEADPKEKDRREALRLYGLALVRERENRFLEAVKLLEDAVKLDPDSAPAQRSLISLYLTLERGEDAIKATRRTLELDPEDYRTWYLYSRILKEIGQVDESIQALQKAAKCKKLKEQPDIHLQVLADLATVCEQKKDADGAIAATNALVKVLNNPRPLMEVGVFPSEKDAALKAAEYLERLGRLCSICKRYDDAVAAFDLAQKKDPERKTRLYFHLAQIHYAQDKFELANKALDEYLKTQPTGTDPYELKIALMKKLGMGDRCVAALKEYSRKDPYNVALLLIVARECGKADLPMQAEQIYKRLSSESPSLDLYRGWFQLYKAQKQSKPVLNLFDEAVHAAADGDKSGDVTAANRARNMLAVLKEDPDLVQAILNDACRELREKKTRSFDTYRLLAVLAARTNRLKEAEDLYWACLAKTTPETEAEIYGNLLRVLWEERKFNDVVRVAKMGLKETKATNRVLFHTNLAMAQAQLGNMTDALADAEKAVELADDESRLQRKLLRVEVLRMAGKKDQAERECLGLLKDAKQPKDIRDIRYALSGIYSSSKNYEKAEDQLRQILEADPNDASANNDLGYILADQNRNLEEAEEMIRKALALDREQRRERGRLRGNEDQDHAAYIDSLGWVLFRRGNFEAAREQLEKATTLPEGIDDPVLWDHLGDVLFRLHDTPKARKAWEKSIELYETEKRRKPDEHYQEVKRKLKALR